MVRILALVFGATLWLHFLFVLALTEHVSVLAVLVFVAATAVVLPPLRTKLARAWLRRVAFLGLILLATSLLEGGNRPDLVRGPWAFVGATILTGQRDAAPLAGGVVLVDEGGQIAAVGSAADVAIPADYTRVDVTGKTLLPGLINAHGHLMLSGRDPDEPVPLELFAVDDWVFDAVGAFLRSYPGRRIVTRVMEKNAQRALEGGVTTLRGLGDPHFLDVALRERIARGEFLGPRLRVAGPVLCVTGGHAHQIGQVFDGPVQARRAVRDSLSHRVDLIKIANTGGVSDSRRIGEAGELQMTPEEIEAIVDEAHRKHVLVAAHAESQEGVLEALRAGVDSIEHGAELGEEAIGLFLRNPRSLRGFTALHPTLSVVHAPIEITASIRANPKAFVMATNSGMIRERMITGYRTAVANGIHIGVGTDAGIVSHGAVWKELRLFHEIGGVSRAHALHLGTLATARSIGVDAITGSIEVGKSADLLVLDRDPSADLASLADPAMVVAAGVIAHRR